MLLTCPNCAADYDVADSALGLAGRKVRCRKCGTSWFQSSVVSDAPGPAAMPVALTKPLEPEAPSSLAAGSDAPAPRRAPRSRLWLLILLVIVVGALGVAAAMLALGPREVAARFGLEDAPMPLGIEISREPDWRMIADGGQLFAVSGRIWNPTKAVQSVPDIRAELKDAQGRTVYAWTITRPAAQLAPGAAVTFDGAAVDVPPASTHVSVSFAGAVRR